MTDQTTPGIEVWFQDSDGNVYERATLPAFPRVGEQIWIAFEEFNVTKVEWTAWTDDERNRKWVVKISVDITPDQLADLEYHDH